MEVDDVLADEVDLLDGRVGQELVEVRARRARACPVEVVLQRGEVADRRIEPDVEVLARRIRDLDAEVGRVARDVPVAEAACRPSPRATRCTLLSDLGLQPARRVRSSCLQELDAARVRQPEEEVLGRLAAPASRRSASSTGSIRSVGA